MDENEGEIIDLKKSEDRIELFKVYVFTGNRNLWDLFSDKFKQTILELGEYYKHE